MHESLKARKTELQILLILGQKVCTAHIENNMNSACPEGKLVCCWECPKTCFSHRCFYSKLGDGNPSCAFTLRQHLNRDPIMKLYSEIKEMLEE